MRTIAIINQKGGCGKTTSAINCAGVLARRGHRTLLVDLDPQGHCAAGLAIPEQRIDIHVGDAMLAAAPGTDNSAAPGTDAATGRTKAIDWTRLLWRVSRNLDLVASHVSLAGLEAVNGGLAQVPHPERCLDAVLTAVADQYDYCLIDCPPSIGLLTFNALFACTEVLIPVETGFFALQGTTRQVGTIRSLAKRLGVTPAYRMVATMHDEASPLQRDVLAELQQRFKEVVVPVVIRLDQALKQAASFGQPAIECLPDSPGAADYSALTDWLIAHPHRAGQSLAAAATAASQAARVQAGPVTVRPASARGLLESGSATAAPAAPAMPESMVEPAPIAAPSGRTAELLSRAQRLTERRGTQDLGQQPLEATRLVRTDERRDVSALYGARATHGGVLFVQPAGLGSALAIAGDFNGWSSTASPMRLNPDLGVYELFVPLPPGPFTYRLVVDGRWAADPFNPEVRLNPFGEPNSLVVVPEAVNAA